MVPIILIIVGGMLVICGIIGMFSVYIQPIKKAIRVFYNQDTDDFWYEHGRGQKTMEEGRRILVGLYTFLIIIGFCLLIPGLVMRYMPRGNASMVSPSEVGADVSMDFEAMVNNRTEMSEYVIVVSGDEVTFCGAKMASLEEFETMVKQLDRTKRVILTDDFAVASTYHKVAEIINRYGLVYGDCVE